MPSHRYKAAVVGTGPAGLAAALALARTGIETELLGPLAQRPNATPDRRTAALFAGSIELLKNLGVWDDVSAESEPITAIRMIDDTGSLLRAPEVTFTAAELGLAEFGWNIPNRVLVAALSRAVTAPESNVRIIETEAVTSLKLDGPEAKLTTKEGQEASAALVVAADGRNSLCRRAAGIETRAWTYPQAAVAAWFTHTRPHGNISTEFHRSAGPFTTVPLPGLASSLVWVETPEEAQRLAALDDDGFRQALEHRLQGLLGSVGEVSPRTVFPLSGLTAKTFGRARVALVGEAAHVIPPIGAQGLNLGLRDAAVLADGVAEATARKHDPGSPAVLDAYEARRRTDVASRVMTVDLLNRSLISGFLPFHLARGIGLHALKSIGPLRRYLVHEGLQPSSAVPTLMRQGGAALMAARLTGDVPHAAA
jgi:2-octaprenyl-6-methoxyphenol hydroxylase